MTAPTIDVLHIEDDDGYNAVTLTVGDRWVEVPVSELPGLLARLAPLAPTPISSR